MLFSQLLNCIHLLLFVVVPLIGLLEWQASPTASVIKDRSRLQRGSYFNNFSLLSLLKNLCLFTTLNFFIILTFYCVAKVFAITKCMTFLGMELRPEDTEDNIGGHLLHPNQIIPTGE